MSERLEELLRTAFPDAAELAVLDRTGGGDHFHVTVVDGRFGGLSLVEQHRQVDPGRREQRAPGGHPEFDELDGTTQHVPQGVDVGETHPGPPPERVAVGAENDCGTTPADRDEHTGW